MPGIVWGLLHIFFLSWILFGTKLGDWLEAYSTSAQSTMTLHLESPPPTWSTVPSVVYFCKTGACLLVTAHWTRMDNLLKLGRFDFLSHEFANEVKTWRQLINLWRWLEEEQANSWIVNLKKKRVVCEAGTEKGNRSKVKSPRLFPVSIVT